VREHHRLAPEPLANSCGEVVDRHGFCKRTAEPDPAELLGGLDAQLAREQRVVADLRVCVEREVVRGEGDPRVEEHLQPPAHRVVDHPRIAVPEEAVVDQEQLGARSGRALEELE
jgi:hypothetical protein